MSRIRADSPDADLVFVPLDLADLDSVREAAEIVKGEARLDVLVNNAGIMMPPLGLTKDGFESQFGVNHLGPFALTGLLLDKPAETPGARAVSTSSMAHNKSRIIFDDLKAEKSYKRIERYGMSKLANLLFAFELQRKLEDAGRDTISVACHPGVAPTDLMRHLSRGLQMIIPIIFRLFGNTLAQGAWPTLMAATWEQAKGGTYFGPTRWGGWSGPADVVPSRANSHDRDAAQMLWHISEDLTGVHPFG